MANDASNVGVGKPKVTGAISIAAVGTELPTDATASLNEAFKGIGYCNEDGVVISEERDSEDIPAWGGDVVFTSQTSYKESISFTPIEINAEVAKMQYGDDNVKVEAGKMAIKHTGAVLPEKSLVVETVPNSKTVARYVVPRGKLTEKGDISLNDSDPMGRESVFTCLPDDTGVTMYEYLAITGLSPASLMTLRSAVSGKTVKEIEQYAADNGIDLSGTKTKADKVAVIAAAVEGEAAGE